MPLKGLTWDWHKVDGPSVVPCIDGRIKFLKTSVNLKLMSGIYLVKTEKEGAS